MRKSLTITCALASVLSCAAHARAQNADVMHWWTSGGELRAVAVFAKDTTSAAAPGSTTLRSDRRPSTLPR